MILARIGNIDLTDYILASTFKSNAESVYREWQDCNYNYHRKEVRRRVIAAFNLSFDKEFTYEDFVLALNKARTGNRLRIELYINNEDATREVDGYYEFSPSIASVEHENIMDVFTFKFSEV